jgi:hypothetical protein
MSDKELAAALGYAAGVVLSLLVKWIPGFNAWYASLSGGLKRLVMFGLLVVVGAVVASASCMNLFHWVSCDEQGLMRLAFGIAGAATGSQVTHLLVSDPTPIRKIKSEAKERHGG